MVARRRRTPYMMRAEVEFLQDGHTEQHNEQAAEPQHPARRPLNPPRHISPRSRLH